MKPFKYVLVTLLTVVIVLTLASTSLAVRNFYAYAGILSPVGATKYALPFAQEMTVSLLNVVVLLCIGISVAIVVDAISQVLYTWEGSAANPADYITSTNGSIVDEKPDDKTGHTRPPPSRDKPSARNPEVKPDSKKE